MPTLREVYEEAAARHGKNSRVAKVLKEQMEAFERGEPLRNLVDREAGY